ncbi:MAG: hypothetical protein ACRD2L_11795 [Terriglobia bacterium]
MPSVPLEIAWESQDLDQVGKLRLFASSRTDFPSLLVKDSQFNGEEQDHPGCPQQLVQALRLFRAALKETATAGCDLAQRHESKPLRSLVVDQTATGKEPLQGGK